MSYSQSTRTTRTYQYSSGPEGAKVIETSTTTGPGGTKTETKTFEGADANRFSDKFGNMSGGNKITINRDTPNQSSRYKKGWGSNRNSQREKNAQKSGLQLTGSYEEIRNKCLQNGALFEDPDFPACDESIFFSKKPPRPFVWKRPPDLVENPQLFVGGASRFDVQQGELGDCWLLAAVASLCGNKNLLYRVVPQDQSFQDQYAGIFRFQFWRYGQWEEVIIDDRVPTYYDRLVFMHSTESNEFWTPLLEKAYAKLVGSYEALKGGSTSEAMEDFTGGVTEMFDLRKSPPGLFKIMNKAQERGSLMGCSIDADPGKLEAELSNGLIMGHAYSITAVREVEVKTPRVTGKIPMVRVRNPWGNEAEWNGAWSDKSQEWKLTTEEERQKIGLNFDGDGEFWMAFSDWVKNFQKLEVCNLGPDSPMDSAIKWEAAVHNGQWKRRVNAGGCRNFLETFWTNPQYRVDVIDADDDEDDTGTLIVTLMQAGRRKLRKEGGELLTMGYVVYKVPDNQVVKLGKESEGPLDVRFFKYNASCAKAPSFINMRSVTGRHCLPPGQYVIVPSTFNPQEEGDFLLRIFSEKTTGGGEMDEDTGISNTQAEEELTDEEKTKENELRAAFKRISGVDMEIDAYELKDILNSAFQQEQFKFDGFSNDTCRSLVAMMDVDLSGKLGFDEFKKLWNNVRLWKTVFKQFDTDKSGTFNSFELRAAFRGIGIKVSNSTFNALILRYSHKDGKIHFDDYIHCIARLKTMFDVWGENNKEGGGGKNAAFSLDEFIQTTMYS